MGETGIEKIAARIIADAREQAAQTLSDAHARANAIRENSNKLLSKAREDAIAKANDDAKKAHERALRMAELTEKQEELRLKREMLEKAFALALERLENLPEDQYREQIAKIVLSAAEGGEEIIIGENRLDEGFLNDINARLQERGLRPLTLSGEKRKNGVYLSKGGMEVACTFVAVLDIIRDDLEPALAAILFPGKEG